MTISSQGDLHNIVVRYFHNPSIMKKSRFQRLDDNESLEHPKLNQRVTPNHFKRTDLKRIKNAKPNNQSIKNSKFFNFGTKNLI